MKIAELHQLSLDELQKKGLETKAELQRLRFLRVHRRLTQPHLMKVQRQTYARIQTIMVQKQRQGISE